MSPPNAKKRPPPKKRPGLKTKKQVDSLKKKDVPSPLSKKEKAAAAAKEKLKLKPSRVSLRLKKVPPPPPSPPNRYKSGHENDFLEMERPETPEPEGIDTSWERPPLPPSPEPGSRDAEMPILSSEVDVEAEMDSPAYEELSFNDINEDEPVSGNNAYIAAANSSSNIVSQSEIDSLNVSLVDDPGQFDSLEETQNQSVIQEMDDDDRTNGENEDEQSAQDTNDAPWNSWDPAQMNHCVWSAVMTKHNLIGIAHKREGSNRIKEKKWKRELLRHSHRSLGILRRFGVQSRSFERQLEPMKKELTELKESRLNEMIMLEAQSTKQVSEAMLNYQNELKNTLKTPAEKTVTVLQHRESERMIMRLRNRIKNIAMPKPNESFKAELRSDRPENVSHEEVQDMPDRFKYEEEHVETMSNDSADEVEVEQNENLGNVSEFDFPTSGAEQMDEDQDLAEDMENEEKPSYLDVEEKPGEMDGEQLSERIMINYNEENGDSNEQYEIVYEEQENVEVNENEVDTQEWVICETGSPAASATIGGLSASETDGEAEVVPETITTAQPSTSIYSLATEHLQLSQSDTDGESMKKSNEQSGMPSKPKISADQPSYKSQAKPELSQSDTDGGSKKGKRQEGGIPTKTDKDIFSPPSSDIKPRPSKHLQLSQSDTDGESLTSKSRRKSHGLFSNTEDEDDLVDTILEPRAVPGSSALKQKTRVSRRATLKAELKPVEEMETEAIGQETEDTCNERASDPNPSLLNQPQPSTSNFPGMSMMNIGMPLPYMGIPMPSFPYAGQMGPNFQQQLVNPSANLPSTSQKVTQARNPRRATLDYPTVRAVKRIPDSLKKKPEKPSIDFKAKFLHNSESESEPSTTGSAGRASFSRLATKRQPYPKLETGNKKANIPAVSSRVSASKGKLTSTSESELEAKKQRTKPQTPFPSRARARGRRSQPTSESDALSDFLPPSKASPPRASTSGGGAGTVKPESADNSPDNSLKNNDMQPQQQQGFPQQLQSPNWQMPGNQGMYGYNNILQQHLFPQGSAQFGQQPGNFGYPPPFMFGFGGMGGGNVNPAMFQQASGNNMPQMPKSGSSSKNKEQQQQAASNPGMLNFPMQGMNYYQPQGGNPGMTFQGQQGKPRKMNRGEAAEGANQFPQLPGMNQFPQQMNHPLAALGFYGGGGIGQMGQQAPGMGPMGQQAPGMGPMGQQAPGMGPMGQQAQGMGPMGQQAQGMGPMGPQAPGMGPMGKQAQGIGPMVGLPVSDSQMTTGNEGDQDSDDSDDSE